MVRLRHLLLVVLALLLTVSFGFAAGKGNFGAKLSGNEVVPTVTTPATGKAEFKLAKDGKDLTYKLTVTDIENVTAAHIHLGKKGKNGGPLAGLFAGPKKDGKFTGVLAEGVITGKDLMGNLKGKPLAALVKLIKAGDTYVNVHTMGHPDGEIRGEIR